MKNIQLDVSVSTSLFGGSLLDIWILHTVEQKIFTPWKIREFDTQAIRAHEIFANFWIAVDSKIRMHEIFANV